MGTWLRWPPGRRWWGRGWCGRSPRWPGRRADVTLAEGTNIAAAASPDGKRLAFQAYRDGNYHQWVANADGSGLRQLTSGPFDHREPKFSPDGRSLVFGSDRGNTGSCGVFT